MSILSLPIEPQNAKNGDMYYNTVEQKYYSFKDGEWVEQLEQTMRILHIRIRHTITQVTESTSIANIYMLQILKSMVRNVRSSRTDQNTLL